MTGRIRNPWVVVAAYNEAPVVGSVVSGIRRAGYAVVVVDDGSSDRTGDVASLAGAVVVRHPVNLGRSNSQTESKASAGIARLSGPTAPSPILVVK